MIELNDAAQKNLAEWEKARMEAYADLYPSQAIGLALHLLQRLVEAVEAGTGIQPRGKTSQ